MAGTYRLDRVVGSGATATVFAATHLRNANHVAVKVLRPELQGNSAIRARFLREGYAANSVGHAGTVRVLDDGTDEDGSVYCVMELLEGESLDALWERRGRRLSPGEVAELMGQLLDVLAAAHAHGVVHRDIKPENLFVERDGTLRVMDFGVARLLVGAMSETRSGSVIGTLPYMAPEQMLGRVHAVDARSDLWSVGATAFTLVSGRFVHEADTPEEMMVFTASRQAISLASVAPDLPPAFVRVVDRALRFDRDERWSSAQSMRDAFADAVLARQTDAGPEDVETASPGCDAVAAAAAPAPVAAFLPRTGAPPFSTTLVSFGAPGRPPTSRVKGRRRSVGAMALTIAAAAMSFAVLRQGKSGMAFARDALPGLMERQAANPTPRSVTATAAAEVEVAPDAPRPEETARAPEADAEGDAVRSDTAGRPLAPPAGIPRPVAPAPARAPTLAGVSASPTSASGLARPDACTPPFTIAATTGKKLWKRACL